MAPSILSAIITGHFSGIYHKHPLPWIRLIYAKSLPLGNILNISILILMSLSVNQIFQYKKMPYWPLKRIIYKKSDANHLLQDKLEPMIQIRDPQKNKLSYTQSFVYETNIIL